MRNPVRRSKKIGLTQGGRVISGRPYEKWSRVDFINDVYHKISESDEKWRIFKENPSRNYFHPCEGEEYLDVMKLLPDNFTRGVKAIVLPRMSKKNEKLQVEGRRKYSCIFMFPFYKSMEMEWKSKPEQIVFRHYNSWCNRWQQRGEAWLLKWELEEIRSYYLFHVFLHELGHINEPNCFQPRSKRENFAENFALEWAKKLGKLP